MKLTDSFVARKRVPVILYHGHASGLVDDGFYTLYFTGLDRIRGALVLLLPGIQIVTHRQFNGKINYGCLFFVAGILGLGGTVSHSGLGDALLPLGEDAPFFGHRHAVVR
ncbi:MAG: hypothetical protein MUP98_12805 [Candidatus Aminicenantes bacterium]|nr:hypothetical protein [Candidatus Aminicenantes bacterium]